MPTPFSNAEEYALALDGRSWRQGSLISPHPAPPLLKQRAELVCERIPEWAVAAGHTAGWVWSGMGRAEPWSLLAPVAPAISPIARQEWKPRSQHGREGSFTSVGNLRLLSLEGTQEDLLTCDGVDEQIACQLFCLIGPESIRAVVERVRCGSGYTATKRERLRRRVTLTRLWWDAHPEVTR